MSLDKSITDLALRYYATGEAIALQTRQIIDEMNAKGHEVKYIFMSGGCVIPFLAFARRTADGAATGWSRTRSS